MSVGSEMTDNPRRSLLNSRSKRTKRADAEHTFHVKVVRVHVLVLFQICLHSLRTPAVVCVACICTSVLVHADVSVLPQTTILAATFNGGVVIGSDSRASIGG